MPGRRLVRREGSFEPNACLQDRDRVLVCAEGRRDLAGEQSFRYGEEAATGIEIPDADLPERRIR